MAIPRSIMMNTRIIMFISTVNMMSSQAIPANRGPRVTHEVIRPGFGGGSQPRRMRVMPAPKKYSEELRERATRMALDAIAAGEQRMVVIRRIAGQLDVHPEALRTWVKRAEVDGGQRPGTTSQDAARIVELEREVRELRRANHILKTASAFFAAELDRPSSR
jgi:transposase